MICEPLELEYLCSSITDPGHKTVIVDMIIENQPIEAFLAEHKPDLLGITAYISHVGIVHEYCRAARRVVPNCHTVIGGVHAEVVPEDFADPSVDFIVNANALATFPLLVRALAAGSSTENIPGLWRPDRPRPVTDPAFRYPWPDRAKVARYRSHYYYLFHNPCALIKTSFGCPNDCTFCFCREVTDGAYYVRELNDVLAELASLPEKDIYIVDDNFLSARKRILAFCRGVQSAGLKKQFLIYGRADFIASNEDVITEFKCAGLRAVIVGLESCRPEDLERFNKRTTVETNEAAVRILARHGVDCYATMILGLDWVAEDFDRLGQWLKKMGLIYVNLQPMTPLPGTRLFKDSRAPLKIARTDYAKWDLAHLVANPTGMTAAAYYRQILRLYNEITLRPAVIWRLVWRHGLKANLRLLAGVRRVARQYKRSAKAEDENAKT